MKKILFSLLVLLTTSAGSYAIPTYIVTAKNFTQNSNSAQFDIFIRNSSIEQIDLTAVQFYIGFDAGWFGSNPQIEMIDHIPGNTQKFIYSNHLLALLILSSPEKIGNEDLLVTRVRITANDFHGLMNPYWYYQPPRISKVFCLINGMQTDISNPKFHYIEFKITGITSSQDEFNYQLFQNYPNPFNPDTRIKFSLSENGTVSLVVYDILGKEVKTILNGYLNAGVYEFNFTSADLPSGFYFYRLKTDNFIETKTMEILK